MATTKKPLNLNKLIDDYLKSPEFTQLEMYNPGVTFKAEIDESLLNINGSYIHLRKIIMKLQLADGHIERPSGLLEGVVVTSCGAHVCRGRFWEKLKL